MVVSGFTGDDKVGRNVVVCSRSVKTAVIREKQSPPQSGRSPTGLSWALAAVVPGPPFTGVPYMRVWEGVIV